MFVATILFGLLLHTISHQARQREVSAGLRATYDKLVKSGMLQEELNPDGTPGDAPDMDEVRVSSEQSVPHAYVCTMISKTSTKSACGSSSLKSVEAPPRAWEVLTWYIR